MDRHGEAAGGSRPGRQARGAARAVSRALAVCAVLLGGACDGGGPTSPWSPDGAVPYEPPAIYRSWWTEVEQCSGLRGRFSNVSWFVVPGRWFPVEGQLATAAWVKQGSRIYVAEEQRERRWVVAHEMLHQLLQARGHPPLYFEQRCGALLEADYTREGMGR